MTQDRRLRGRGEKYLVLSAVFVLSGLRSPGQDPYPSGAWNPASPGIPEEMMRARINQDLNYSLSLSAMQFLHRGHEGNRNQLVCQQSLKYNVSIGKDSSLIFSNSLAHDLGLQCFFDSTLLISPDETSLSTKLSFNFRKKFSIILTSGITTRLLDNFELTTDDQGRQTRVLGTSFMTPVTLSLTFGIGHTWPGFGEISLGLTSTKLTWLRDSRIFDRLNTVSLFGVSREKSYRFDYGLSLRLLIDREVLRSVHWNCDLLLFKGAMSALDFSLKNLISINLGRFIRTSIQTRILFEEKTDKSVRVENNLNIGFSLQL